MVGATRALGGFPSLSPWGKGKVRRLTDYTKRAVLATASLSRGETVISISPELPKKQQPLGLGHVVAVVELSSSLAAEATRGSTRLFQTAAATRISSLQAEMLIERGIVGCRSFLLIAVAGSLIGSILCFVEGIFLVLESYFHYFHTISQTSDQGGIIHLLIESIDMFLVGTSLLTFGMGLYVIFAGSKGMKSMPESNHFGQFSLKRLSNCMEMQSIAHAKSKLGHAMLLILQAGVVDKFKNVPLTSSLDLACFAAAVLITSASVFLLSKLAVHRRPEII